jgi:hypothetical protein
MRHFRMKFVMMFFFINKQRKSHEIINSRKRMIVEPIDSRNCDKKTDSLQRAHLAVKTTIEIEINEVRAIYRR